MLLSCYLLRSLGLRIDWLRLIKLFLQVLEDVFRCEWHFLALLHLLEQLACGLTSLDLDVEAAHRYHARV